MSKCPNKYSPEWLELVDTIGLENAYREFLIHDGVPSAKNYQKQDLNNIKHDIQSEINRAVLGRQPENTIQTALSILRGIKGAGSSGEGTGQEVIWKGIKGAGLEYKGELGKGISSGQEHDAYKLNDKILKVRYGLPDYQLESYVRDLIVHNKLFPSTKYKLEGFIREGGAIHPVVTQPEIKRDNTYNSETIEKIMSIIGFTKIGPTDYENPEIGTIGDLFARNVFFKDDIPFFIDPLLDIKQSFYREAERLTPEVVDKNLPDQELDKKLATGFLNSLGVNVNHVINEGQDYKALLDTNKRIIEVVNGNADKTTLGHEATHLFLDLLPDDSKLLKTILDDVMSRREYDDIYDRYQDDPEYQNADGSVNEEKMAKEAAAHIIDDIIVDKFQDKKAMKWWEKLWNWIVSKFKGKSIDAYSQVAEDVLDNNTTKLSKEKIKAMQESNNKGEIYYQLSPEHENLVKKLRDNPETSKTQKAIINGLYLKTEEGIAKLTELGIKPTERVILEDDTHTYTDLYGQVYSSTTKKISGEFSEDKQEQFEANRLVGNDCDALFQAVILGDNIDSVETKTIPDKMKQEMFSGMQDFLSNYMTGNEIALPQMVVSDPVTKIAGSIDMVMFSPEGFADIVDLKTSINKVYNDNGTLSSTYTSKWQQNPGSIFNELTFDKKNNLVPREGEQTPVKLSKQLQHGIQVGTYGKMLELQGIPVKRLFSWHLNVDITKNDQGQPTIKSWKNDGVVYHNPEDNKPYIDQVVNTPIDESNLSQLQKDYLDIKEPEQPADDYIPTKEETEALNETLHTTLDSIKKEFIRRKASALAQVRESSLNELKNTVADIADLQNQGEVQNAMAKAISYIQDITRESFKFLSNKNNFNHRQYFQFLRESQQIAASNDLLLPPRIRKALNPDQKKLFDNIKENISELQELASIRAKEYVLDKVNKLEGIDTDSLKELWFPEKGMSDISQTGSWATNFDSLRNPIIREASHKAQVAITEANIRDVAIREHWNIQGSLLAQIAGKAIEDKNFYNFLYNLDKNGNPTGYINPIGEEYYDIQDKLQSTLLGNDLQYKKYVPVKSLDKATPEQLEYNINLYHDKEALREFSNPEQLDQNGEIVAGTYHYLDTEYTQARSKVMKPLIHRNWEGVPLYLEWIPKDGYTEESKEVKSYRNKYMVKDTYDSMVKKKGKPTGLITEKEGWFPNRQHVVPNHFAGNKDMRNPRYVKLITPTNDLEKAQYNFYQEFIKSYVEGAKKMGGEAERFVANLGIVALQGKVFQKAAETGILKNIEYNRVEFFTAVHKGNVESTDTDGVTRMALRIPYIGSLRSKEKVQLIQDKIAVLTAKKPSMGTKEYRAELKALNIELERESHKLDPESIERDAVKQIIAWATAANTYDAMERIEGQLLALQWALKEQKFIKTTGTGIAKVDGAGNPVYKEDKDVHAYRAMDQFFKNFYGVRLEDSQLGIILKRFQNLTSFMVMGLNIFNGLNNTFLYQLNLIGHSLSGRYGLSAKGWTQAQKVLTTEYIPGMTRKALDRAGKYDTRRSYSAAEAYLKKYAIKFEKVAAEGASSFFGKFYIFENMAIDLSLVTLSINAAIDSQIKNHDTGEFSSVWDAHTYDPNTGAYTLNKGFSHDDVVANVVRTDDIQTQVQGNYRSISQPAMTSTLLGGLTTQFHRFFPTTWNNRLGRHYTHPTLGEMEGSWRSCVSLVEMLRNYDGKWQEAFNPKSEFWKEVPEHVKRNLMFDAFDIIKLTLLFAIGAVLKGIADDISEDDANQKRWMNFIAYTASRLRFEEQMFNPIFGWVQMGEFVKNPAAMSNTLTTFAEAMYLTAEFPFQTDDERNYKNGVFKGKSKAGHQIQKLIPIWRQGNQWINHIKSQTAEGSVLGGNK